MRITLDTNVLIAAFISRGSCHEIFEHIARNHQLIVSDFILQEFKTILTGKFGFTEKEAKEAADLIRVGAISVEPIKLDKAICSDSDDDNIIATAISGNCQCILSGDKDLTKLKEIKGIIIMNPAEFWKFE